VWFASYAGAVARQEDTRLLQIEMMLSIWVKYKMRRMCNYIKVVNRDGRLINTDNDPGNFSQSLSYR
jgi:hypothetical protein